jgi:hypothetical protein
LKIDKTFHSNVLDSNKGFIKYQDIVPNAEKLSIEIWEEFGGFR